MSRAGSNIGEANKSLFLFFFQQTKGWHDRRRRLCSSMSPVTVLLFERLLHETPSEHSRRLTFEWRHSGFIQGSAISSPGLFVLSNLRSSWTVNNSSRCVGENEAEIKELSTRTAPAAGQIAAAQQVSWDVQRCLLLLAPSIGVCPSCWTMLETRHNEWQWNVFFFKEELKNRFGCWKRKCFADVLVLSCRFEFVHPAA